MRRPASKTSGTGRSSIPLARRLFPDRSSFARDLLNTFVGKSLAYIIGAARTVLVPTLLGPVGYGLWRLLLVFDAFSRCSHLGTVSALTRQIPFYLGRKDVTRAAKARLTAFRLTLIGAVVMAGGLLVAGFTVRGGALLVPFAAFAAYNFANRLILYYQTVLKSERRFGNEARINILNAALATPVVLFGVYFFGLNGLIVASAVVSLTMVGVYRASCGGSISGSIDREDLSVAVRVGFPILVTGLLAVMMRNTDKIMIGSMLGVNQLGLFALGSAVAERLGQFGWMIGTVTIPRFAERYGQDEDVQALRHLVERQALTIGLIFPFVSLAALFVGEVLFANLWQSYRGGATAYRIQVCAVMFVAVYMSYAGFFATIRKQVYVVGMHVLVLGVNILGNYTLIRAGWGIEGAALSTACCLTLLSVAQTSVALRHFHPWSGVMRATGRIYAGPVLAIGLVLVAQVLVSAAGFDAAPALGRLAIHAAAVALYGAFAAGCMMKLGLTPAVIASRLRSSSPASHADDGVSAA